MAERCDIDGAARMVSIVLVTAASANRPCRREILAELVDAGVAPERVATIYDVSTEDVAAAIRYEREIASRRAA